VNPNMTSHEYLKIQFNILTTDWLVENVNRNMTSHEYLEIQYSHN
jgi:hypothetical protein